MSMKKGYLCTQANLRLVKWPVAEMTGLRGHERALQHHQRQKHGEK